MWLILQIVQYFGGWRWSYPGSSLQNIHCAFLEITGPNIPTQSTHWNGSTCIPRLLLAHSTGWQISLDSSGMIYLKVFFLIAIPINFIPLFQKNEITYFGLFSIRFHVLPRYPDVHLGRYCVRPWKDSYRFSCLKRYVIRNLVLFKIQLIWPQTLYYCSSQMLFLFWNDLFFYSQECWKVERCQGMAPVYSCEGLQVNYSCYWREMSNIAGSTNNQFSFISYHVTWTNFKTKIIVIFYTPRAGRLKLLSSSFNELISFLGSPTFLPCWSLAVCRTYNLCPVHPRYRYFRYVFQCLCSNSSHHSGIFEIK